MSLFENLKAAAKGATGIGLSADEKYARAYEKGVFLQDYAASSKTFREAAKQFEEGGQAIRARQALANAALYDYLTARTPETLGAACRSLEHIDEIEAPGSRDETLPAADLHAELQGRQFESLAFQAQDQPARALDLHRSAAGCFRKLIGKELQTYRLIPTGFHDGSAQERYFYHEGLASYFSGLQLRFADPEGAAGLLSTAVQHFRQAGNQDWQQRCSAMQADLKAKRTCWFCHREMQGVGLNVDFYPARIAIRPRSSTGLTRTSPRCIPTAVRRPSASSAPAPSRTRPTLRQRARGGAARRGRAAAGEDGSGD